ncbi:hypothetical protein P692DRAFT_20836444 [Suillus brevipes Sb2]|nr:hypothetical protein P692DRAFT_20836444 [Suillus brevipes Sb2]
MHFSFLAVIVALTSSIAVSACGEQHTACTVDSQCCPPDMKCVTYDGLQTCDFPDE